MKFLSNAHTHTRYCDGKDSPAEMAQAAKRLGFVSLGFSGHGAQGFDSAYAMDDGRQEAYRLELRELQAKLREETGAPRLWVGVEQDALVSAEQKVKNRKEFDYILGATHYLSRDWNGRAVAVDGDLALLQAYVRKVWDGDGLAMAKVYFDAHVDMLLEDRPDIIGHFDLVRKNLRAFHGFDLESAAYRKLALNALEKARACGGVLEVNTGSIARGYQAEPYPSEELLAAWRDMDGAVTLTSDCHDARHLDFGFEAARGMLRRLGYRRVLRLGTGDLLWEAVECTAAS